MSNFVTKCKTRCSSLEEPIALLLCGRGMLLLHWKPVYPPPSWKVYLNRNAAQVQMFCFTNYLQQVSAPSWKVLPPLAHNYVITQAIPVSLYHNHHPLTKKLTSVKINKKKRSKVPLTFLLGHHYGRQECVITHLSYLSLFLYFFGTAIPTFVYNLICC